MRKRDSQLIDKRQQGLEAYKFGIIFGLVIGGLLCLLGVVLLLMGFAGSIEWLVEAPGIKSKLINASPGIVLSVMGLVILIVYRPRGKEKLSVTNNSYEHDIDYAVDMMDQLRNEIFSAIGIKGTGISSVSSSLSHSLQDFIHHISSEKHEIDILAASLYDIVRAVEFAQLDILKSVSDAMKRGVACRIAIADPKLADTIAGRNTSNIWGAERIREDFENIVQVLRDLGLWPKSVALLNELPSMFIVKTTTRMLIAPYPFSFEVRQTPLALETYGGSELFNIFASEFEQIWNHINTKQATERHIKED